MDKNRFSSSGSGYWEQEETESKSRFIDRLSPPQRQLMRNVLLCAMLALLLWGVRIGETTDMNTTAVSGKSAQYTEDETMGRLKYVNGDNVVVTSEDYSLPMNGEVVKTFADTEKSVSISGSANSKVFAMLSGTVSKVEGEDVTITNANGTTTTYGGIKPGVTAGETVKNADVIGTLEGEELTLTTYGGVGYMDPLNSSELLGTDS